MKQYDFQYLVFMKQLSVLIAAMAVGILVYLFLNLLFNQEDLKGLKDAFSREEITKG
jgi:putative peptidoglycan lipid II flippase